MKKSKTPYYLLSIIYTLSLTPLATAGPVEGIRQLAQGLGETIYILIEFIVNTLFTIESFNQFLVARIMIAIIVLLVVYTVINKNNLIGDKKPIHWIIASAITILTIRFMPQGFIEMILIQYTSLGVALTVFLPLIIFFFFIQQSGMGPLARRAGWLIYGATFLALWYQSENLSESAEFIYWIGLLFITASLIFDRKIHEYFGLRELKEVERESNANRYIDLEAKARDIHNKLNDGNIPESIKKINRKRLEKIEKELKKLARKI
jgi:hypothetical protein